MHQTLNFVLFPLSLAQETPAVVKFFSKTIIAAVFKMPHIFSIPIPMIQGPIPMVFPITPEALILNATIVIEKNALAVRPTMSILPLIHQVSILIILSTFEILFVLQKVPSAFKNPSRVVLFAVPLEHALLEPAIVLQFPVNIMTFPRAIFEAI